MRTFRGVWPPSVPKSPVVTLGNFDGVHLGHQAIFHQVKRHAREIDGTSVVLTFHPHPRRFFKPDSPPFLLCSEEERIRLIQESGIDLLVISEFSPALAELTPEAFVHEILLGRLGTKAIYVGYDFNFGKGRVGDYDTLKRLGAAHGLEVDLIPEVLYDGATISSSRVRRLVASGDMAGAREVLGRSYRLIGPVLRGEGLGRRIGFPTANIGWSPDRLLPAFGVYAAWALVEDQRWLAAVNIGLRPTVAGRTSPATVEAHLLDYPGRSLYDQTIELRFLEYIRPEMNFPGIEALVGQIRLDVEWVREHHGTVGG